MNFEDCTEEEQERYKGAYIYLKYENDTDKYINDKLTNEDIEKFEQDTYYQNENKYIYEHKDLDEMNIEGYSKIYYFKDDFDHNDTINTKDIKIFYGVIEERQTIIDLSRYMMKIIIVRMNILKKTIQ